MLRGICAQAADMGQALKKIPWCQIVCGVKLSVFTHGVKLSAVSNCPGVKLSGVKLSWCQIVRCQIVRGVKLSGVKLSWCQIVRQHGRCQIVRGVKLSGVKLSALSNCPMIRNMDAYDNLSDD